MQINKVSFSTCHRPLLFLTLYALLYLDLRSTFGNTIIIVYKNCRKNQKYLLNAKAIETINCFSIHQYRRSCIISYHKNPKIYSSTLYINCIIYQSWKNVKNISEYLLSFFFVLKFCQTLTRSTERSQKNVLPHLQ